MNSVSPQALQPCPSNETVWKFLADELDAGEEAQIASHLEDCQACQALMQRHISGSGSAPRFEVLSHDAPLALKEALYGMVSELLVTVDQPLTQEPGSVIGNYKLLQKIGEGGMGTVFMAEQTHPVRRTVALKIIKPGLDSRQVIARFESERQALAMMDHPFIAKVLDGGVLGVQASVQESADLANGGTLTRELPLGRPYFVMELVKGIPITEFCAQQKLDTRARLELFIDVCRAVQHAHQKGVIHRDLKPSNILVELHDVVAVPKVIDFGLAKAMHEQLTERTLITNFAQILGTPLYMSPEQAQLSGLDIDTRSDLYSLGVLLYELLTGTTPFDPETLRQAGYDEMRRIIREDDPPRPSQRVSTLKAEALSTLSQPGRVDARRLSQTLRGELDWIVMKCLEKDRSRRYESASALVSDLQRYLKDEPVEACPPSALYTLQKFARRHKRMVQSAAVAMLALVVALIGVTWGLVEAQRGRTLAEQREQEAQLAAVSEDKAKREALAKKREAEQAAIEARKAEQAARESEADTRAFSDFLVAGVLSAARPTGQRGGMGIEVTVRDALQGAEEAIAERFKDQPRAEAVVRHDLGVTFRLIGDLQRAEPHLRRAVALRQEVLGADHLTTLHSENSLAVLLNARGKTEEALLLYERLLDKYRSKLGADHPDTLHAMTNLGAAYTSVGKAKSAVPLHEEALKLQTEKHGRDSSQTLTTLHNLASAYLDLGRLDEALELLEEVCQRQTSTKGPDHSDTLSSMSQRGVCLYKLRRFREAEAVFTQLLERSQTVLGLDHPDTLRAKFNLAMQYKALKRLDQARQLLEENFKQRSTKLGAVHPETLITMRELMQVYLDSKMQEQGLELAEQTLGWQRIRLGVDHPETLALLLKMGRAYRNAGKLDRATALLEEAFAAIEQSPVVDGTIFNSTVHSIYLNLRMCLKAPEHRAREEDLLRRFMVLTRRHDSESPSFLDALRTLGIILIEHRKFTEAEPFLREYIAASEKLRPDNYLTPQTKSHLGGALTGQARALQDSDPEAATLKFKEAESCLLQGYEGLKAKEPEISAQFRDRNINGAVTRIVELYEAWDQPEKANAWKKLMRPSTQPP